jgi:FixJ family two-component response regulator
MSAKPRVICVDDEPQVLSGLTLHLRRRYEVEIATSGAAGLELLAKTPAAAVVISDMRMPGMSGAEFLAKACDAHPSTSRILLTGHADVDAAIAAVNHGHVFRFLVKPCPPPELMKAVEAAAELYRLTTAEVVLLEQTLRGSVEMLSDVLSITNPVAFGRATRIKSRVSKLLDELGIQERWQIEVAAMLSQLGALTLPPETAEKLHYGVPLTDEEEQMVARAPATVEQLLAHIPRLEAVREILTGAGRPFRAVDKSEADPHKRLVQRGANLLKAALELDGLEAEGLDGAAAARTLKGRAEQFDPELLEALLKLCGTLVNADAIREVTIASLKEGMVFASDVKLATGTLLVARGFEVTAGFLARIRNFRPGAVKEPFKVTFKHKPE